MARLALDRRWESLPVEQRHEFVETLAGLAQHAFLERMSGHRDSAIRYRASSVDGEQASVTAELSECADDGAPRVKMKLEYHLMRKNGRWVVYDVVVDGQSLVASYREQFSRLLRTEPFDVLLARMKRRLDREQREQPM
jgi:phospholipid transport system substrate-binding protein